MSSSSCCRLGRSASAATGVRRSDHCYYCQFQPSDEGGVERQRAFFCGLPELAYRHTLGVAGTL